MQCDFSLPPECTLRKAVPHDIWLIIFVVFRARLDPSQLRWQQFWIIECDGRLIAFGQLRKFHSAQELGSLFVAPAWRNRGLGTFLVQHLIAQATQPLYLKCLKPGLAEFYRRRGFVPVTFKDLPLSLKPKFQLSQLRKSLLKAFVLFMKYQDPG
ncbi:MAG: GNAT family N-acetyltransferase [Mojavia pulchra JT2-VF2]|jgi:amino-acid N-acetyltransferase|uniref:GNAT family N-acetyltransferase n=1 Tax=Mojavia pulchra JT2-VF2 TaxID=287848 RepID=A0A951ULA8_9NOST|nr:GNAT family N-acetyltransferase [Mojavia pulchra JT2-VF2]